MEVIAIFDIGKTTKKFLLFDSLLNPVYVEEKKIDGSYDDDGFPCDDFEEIETWMRSSLAAVIKDRTYTIRALNFTAYEAAIVHLRIEGYNFITGNGITDNAAALVPYLKGTKEQFILIAAGNWCVFMNPFNNESLTAEQLRSDTLCYMSVNQNHVISSRFFLGHIHDLNVKRLKERYGVTDELYKTITIKSKQLWRMLTNKHGRIFFRNGIPAGEVDNEVNLSQFLTFADAYHQLIFDLVDVCMESFRLILPSDDKTEVVYISGGFARNDTFIHSLAARLPDKRVFSSEISDSSALGAAMEVYESAFGVSMPPVYLGLRAVLIDL
jgi:hypothetical protein